MSTGNNTLAYGESPGNAEAFTIAISTHAEEADQDEVDDKESPGEEATPNEDEMNYLCHVLVSRSAITRGSVSVYSQRAH